MRGLESTIESFSCFKVTDDNNRVAWALKAMTLTDLTTLSGDDCHSNVERLCIRACYPFSKDSIIGDNSNDLEFLKKLHVAAVCVYPTKVKDAYDTLERLHMVDQIQIAAGNYFSVFIDINYNILYFQLQRASRRAFILSRLDSRRSALRLRMVQLKSTLCSIEASFLLISGRSCTMKWLQ